MRCPRCLDDNPAGAKFCNGCGAPLELACLACQHANPAGSRLCNECGMEVKTGSHFPAGNQVVFLGRYVEHQMPSGVSAIEIPGIIFPAGLPFGFTRSRRR